MKFVSTLVILAILVADVKPFKDKVQDAIFKKYATMKILEDCYGQETLNNMLLEIGLAFAQCRRQPSFLPILEQLVAPAAAPASTTTTSAPTTMSTEKPVEEVPFVSQEPQIVKDNVRPVAPLILLQPARPVVPPQQQRPVSSYPWNYNDRYWSDYYRPSYSSQYQPQYPYDYLYGMNEGGYRWKRDNSEVTQAPDEEMPVTYTETPTPFPVTDLTSVPEEGSIPPSFVGEIVGMSEVPTIATVDPAVSPSLSISELIFSKILTTHESLISNMTCVLQKMNFMGEDMQPNFEAIRERIDKMPLTSELKTDFFEGIETCKEFSSCIPVNMYGNVPVMKDLMKPLSFFKCFKGRKIEACMKKDLRDKFGSLLSGITSNIRSQLNSPTTSGETDGMDKVQSIFNMVYGFDMDNTDSFF